MIPVAESWLEEKARDAHRVLEGHASDNLGNGGRCIGDIPATLCNACSRAASMLALIAAYREAIETVAWLKQHMPEEVVT